jgi:hypothetical protein
VPAPEAASSAPVHALVRSLEWTSGVATISALDLGKSSIAAIHAIGSVCSTDGSAAWAYIGTARAWSTQP